MYNKLFNSLSLYYQSEYLRYRTISCMRDHMAPREYEQNTLCQTARDTSVGLLFIISEFFLLSRAPIAAYVHVGDAALQAHSSSCGRLPLVCFAP